MTTSQSSKSASIRCTLDTDRREAQTLEWSDLIDVALETEATSNGVVSTYPIMLASQIEDLAARENACCGSWLTIVSSRTEEAIRLEVTTTHSEGLETIKALAGLDA